MLAMPANPVAVVTAVQCTKGDPQGCVFLFLLLLMLRCESPPHGCMHAHAHASACVCPRAVSFFASARRCKGTLHSALQGTSNCLTVLAQPQCLPRCP